MKIDRPNTLIVFCQNRGYKKLPKNIPVENLGRDIKNPQNNEGTVTYTYLDEQLFRWLTIKGIDTAYPISIMLSL